MGLEPGASLSLGKLQTAASPLISREARSYTRAACTEQALCTEAELPMSDIFGLWAPQNRHAEACTGYASHYPSSVGRPRSKLEHMSILTTLSFLCKGCLTSSAVS